MLEVTRRLSILGLVAVSLALVAATTAAGQRLSTNKSWIPTRVQREIEKSYPSLAYGPTWLPPDYRFGGYARFRKFFVIAFGVAFGSATSDALSWTVVRAGKASCDPTGWKPYRLNGVTVYWGGTTGDQNAWRCIERAGERIKLDAAASSDDGHLNTPKKRRDALVLAKTVAYAKPLP